MRRIEATAPSRCGIIGNPSDIYGGFVVSSSTPMAAKCVLTLGEDGPRPQDPTLLNAALSRLPLNGSFTIEWSTEVPRSSGLAGSTALLAATVACILVARGEQHIVEDRVALAELVRDIERHEAGVMCGYQDAYMVVHGGVQAMDFSGKHPVNPGPPAKLTSLNCSLPFLLVTTGVERLSGSVHGPMSERWLAGDREVIEAMERITELGRTGAEALQAADWGTLASAMTENHTLVAKLGGSGEAIDALIEKSLKHCALAAKLAGAGMGGTVIALAHDLDGLQAGLRAEGYSIFSSVESRPGLTWREE